MSKGEALGPISWSKGQRVEIEGMRGVGRIVDVDEARSRARVEIGSAHWTVGVDRLRPANPADGEETEAGPSVTFQGGSNPPQYELDLHRLQVEEALQKLDKFLDSAIVHRLPSVKVIHGHGTGRLRDAVRRALADHPQVADFHFGGPAQGGLAVTMVTLR